MRKAEIINKIEQLTIENRNLEYSLDNIKNKHKCLHDFLNKKFLNKITKADIKNEKEIFKDLDSIEQYHILLMNNKYYLMEIIIEPGWDNKYKTTCKEVISNNNIDVFVDELNIRGYRKLS